MRARTDVSARDEDDRRWSAWMRKAQSGDAVAYEALLRDCVPHVRRVARALGTPVDYVDDVVQDTLLTIDRARHAFEPDRSFTAWLNAIARRRAVDVLRRCGRRQRFEVHEPLALESFVAEGSEEAPLAARVAFERSRRLREAMVYLTPGQKEAVDAIGLREQTLEETAVSTGRSKGALKVTFHRAMKVLRDRIQRDA